jgi:hypothetical protein
MDTTTQVPVPRLIGIEGLGDPFRVLASGRQLREGRPHRRHQGAVMTRYNRPKLAVWKLASCDGCQLTLLDCED